MGVTASVALLRVHVLVVELPGRPVLRLRAEAAVRARGWAVVCEPEDADVVLVCGTPRVEIADAVDGLWARVPAPRARRTVRAPEELTAALDSAARVLVDDALQRRAAAEARPAPPVVEGRFGPLAPGWPAGLVIDRALEPDGRIAAVGVRRLAAEPEEDPLEHAAVALAVADAARLLRLTGWSVAALRLDRVADLLVEGRPPDRVRRRIDRVRRAVERSATFRWSARRELPEVDVRARVLALLAAAAGGEAPSPAPDRVLVGRPAAGLPLLVAATEPAGAGG